MNTLVIAMICTLARGIYGSQSIFFKKILIILLLVFSNSSFADRSTASVASDTDLSAAFCAPVINYTHTRFCNSGTSVAGSESVCQKFLLTQKKITNYLMARFFTLRNEEVFNFSLQVSVARQSGLDTLALMEKASKKCAEYAEISGDFSQAQKCMAENGASDLGFKKCYESNLLPY